jgi:nucleoside-diphosphate-sugar epimerase
MDLIINQDVVFDYLFIDDLVKVTDYFINNKGKFSTYNVTPVKSISLNEICQIINKIAPVNSDISIMNKGLNNRYSGDNRRLTGEIKNLKFTAPEEGIGKLFLYYKNNLDNFDRKIIETDQYLKHCNIRRN